VANVQANRLDVARDFATAHNLWVILKGHRTVIATPDGEAFINLTGNPGMATAGTGDVLTGVVAAWRARRLGAVDAAVLSVHLHGLAGDLAARDGEAGLIASDVIEHLRAALVDLCAGESADAPASTRGALQP
jgi:NAD(P)H-hydrate epimerase